MPTKLKSIYRCQKCDAQFPKWSGRCLECGGWGTLSLETKDEATANKEAVKVAPAKVQDLRDVAKDSGRRLTTGVGEIDRVLGGGLMPGSLVLISGEPGIGKSTLLAQLASAIPGGSVLYASGEESAAQVKERMERLNCDLDKIKFLSETNVEKIISTLEELKPALLVVDSIQTMYSLFAETEPGGITQVRVSTLRFLETAKKLGTAIVLVGHITKDGTAAGPKTLEHIVDAVLYLETDPAGHYRILRAAKNRFGSIDEVGIFEMTGSGLKEVANPSAVFISPHMSDQPGSVTSVVIEGTRPFLVEIQALVSKTPFGYPQRKASGFDSNRLQVLCAVLTKRGGVNLLNQDVILNVVGGLKINDPALDLAVCLSIVSSLLNLPVAREAISLGEVGLGGEVRGLAKLKERVNEAAKLGYKTAIVPDIDFSASKIQLKKIKRLSDIVEYLRG